MKYDRENLNDPMYREYVENRELENIEEERDLLREEQEEEFAVREEERIIAMEGFNPINTEILEDGLFENEVIQEGIIANERLYNFEEERQLEEDMDIIQAGKDPNW